MHSATEILAGILWFKNLSPIASKQCPIFMILWAVRIDGVLVECDTVE